MFQNFHYSDAADQEFYAQETIPLGDKTLTVRAATIAGDPEKPNEDAFALTYNHNTLFAGIFDGTTSLKAIKSLGKQTGARFASHNLKKNFAGSNTDNSPEEILLKLNLQLLQKSLQLKEATLSDTHTLPSSTATIIKLDSEKNELSFAHVGDSLGIIYYTNGQSLLFTNDTNSKFDKKMFSLIDRIAKEKKISPRHARNESSFKEALIAMFIARNNNPNGKGSGVINGETAVVRYIQSGTYPLQDVTAILLATDGIIPQGWDEKKELYRQKIYQEINDNGFDSFFKIKKKSENADPDWYHIRYKHSDDATGVILQLQ